ncbi:MAG: hypothetical protein KC422_12685 [Trueperaceae bacterium]|nr:hypothetical protein [Trueperaceae bacterium]
MVKRYVYYLKCLTEEQLNALTQPSFHKPGPKQLSYFLRKPEDGLSEDIKQFFTCVTQVDEDFVWFKAESTAFGAMIKERQGDSFNDWLDSEFA